MDLDIKATFQTALNDLGYIIRTIGDRIGGGGTFDKGVSREEQNLRIECAVARIFAVLGMVYSCSLALSALENVISLSLTGTALALAKAALVYAIYHDVFTFSKNVTDVMDSSVVSTAKKIITAYCNNWQDLVSGSKDERDMAIAVYTVDTYFQPVWTALIRTLMNFAGKELAQRQNGS